MFCLSSILNISAMFPFFKTFENISHFEQFLNKKGGSIIVARHFQHPNNDHVMNMSFIRIEFIDDSFLVTLHDFNVFQVMIGNWVN